MTDNLRLTSLSYWSSLVIWSASQSVSPSVIQRRLTDKISFFIAHHPRPVILLGPLADVVSRKLATGAPYKFTLCHNRKYF